ncbi:helix-turn-helix domain-containing protein [Desulfosarcina ovata]|uniref:HTH iclR-type domain-containing protein n=1 Tax=Desulfosarcina ovata subsp. ovata TaxID=2752305 RepID=A0A5K8AKB5_9BACT|nr:helix-turn-helix domain-containing protein [Desulfosarcina ovata]BBO93131.1 hypothetical protein DSCOOX_63110 [Desulfosarcina ovata subsp. ovata]
MSLNYKRVPAIDKCFSILSLMADAKRPFRFYEIVKRLKLNKSTVFNILHTLHDLNVLERGHDGLFRLGPQLYILGKAAAQMGVTNQIHHVPQKTVDHGIQSDLNLGQADRPEAMPQRQSRSVAYDQDKIRMLIENSEIFRCFWWDMHMLTAAGGRHL